MTTKLLNIDANAKTVKGQKQGYMTAVMYLAPYTASGRNVCPNAEKAQCWQGCLNTAGRGGIAKDNAHIIASDGNTLPDNAIQRARLRRTALYWDDRGAFMSQLEREIEAFIKKAKRKGLVPVVRLNGTSDIQWERNHPVSGYRSIFDRFPHVQFYDYTKMPARFDRKRINNYHLSLSFSGANAAYADECYRAYASGKASLVCVVRDKESKEAKLARPTSIAKVDGDKHDLRFTDPDNCFVFLTAKGRAKRDTSGFVMRA